MRETQIMELIMFAHDMVNLVDSEGSLQLNLNIPNKELH